MKLVSVNVGRARRVEWNGFSRADMGKRFLEHGGTGFYLAVRREGDVAAGDAIALVERGDLGVTVAEIVAGKRARSMA